MWGALGGWLPSRSSTLSPLEGGQGRVRSYMYCRTVGSLFCLPSSLADKTLIYQLFAAVSTRDVGRTLK